jgi:hypothetical protein
VVRRALLLTALAAAVGVTAVPVAAVAQEAGPTGTLTGTVTIIGGPGAGLPACVWVLGTDLFQIAQAETDPETQRYAVDVPPGDYLLRFDGTCNGAPAVPELHPDVERWDDATPVTVVAGGTTTVDAELDPWTPIGGRIVDQFGDPVSCSVSSWREPSTSTSIVFGGAYSLWSDGTFDAANGGLAAGLQRLEFHCPAGYAPPEPRIVTVGDDPSVPFELGELVAPLQPGSLSGTLASEGDYPYPLGNACVLAISPSGVLLGLTLAVENHWSFAGLPVGPVRLAFRDCSRDAGSQEFLAEWYGDTTDFASAQEVVVDAGAPVAHVDATVTRWAHIAGGVFDANGQLAGRVCMWVTDVTQTRMVGAAYIPDRFFATVRLLPGEYKVLITDCGGGWRSVWVGGTDDPATAQIVSVGFNGTNIGATVTPK